MSTATSPETVRKIVLLMQEIAATIENGPREKSLTSLLDSRDSVVMWDAVPLARELLPELSLHFHRMAIGGSPPISVLHYVLVRETNEVIGISESALEQWLTTNSGVLGAERVESAMRVVRSCARDFEPEVRKRVLRHAALISKEVKDLLRL